jgi:transposase
VLDQIVVGRDGPGRPRKRPDRVPPIRPIPTPRREAQLRRRRIAFTSPERRDQIEDCRAKGSRGGRPPAFDPELYAGRNVVERCFNRLNKLSAIATRYANERPTTVPKSPSPPWCYGCAPTIRKA